MLTKIENLQDLYEKDFILWIEKNVQAIKDGKFNLVDFENVIEELETLGRSEKRAVESLLKQILINLLIYEYWTEQKDYNGHHWKGEIIAFRDDLKSYFKSKTLENHGRSELENIYQSALERAINKTGLNIFPDQCPYTFEQIINKNWLPLVS